MSAFDCLINLKGFLLHRVLYNWLSIEHVAKLDSAYCSSAKRQLLLDTLSSRGFIQHDLFHLSFEHHFSWYIRRSIGMSNIHINTKLSVNEHVSDYLFKWGQGIRKIHISNGASGDLYLIPMHCKNLTSISVSNNCVEMQHICHDILRFNLNLREVAFRSCVFKSFVFKDVHLPQLHLLRLTNTFVSDTVCRIIGQLCDGLTHLSLSGSSMDCSGLTELTARQKQLISLDLSHTAVGANAIATVVPYCGDLVNLSLNDCENINDSAILSISQHLSDLRSLDIRRCDEISNMSLRYLTEYSVASQLTALYLGYSDIALVEMAAFLRQCVSLHTLGIGEYDDMVFALEDFGGLCKAVTSIKKLHLRGATLIKDNALELIGRYCRNITHLALLTDDEPEYEHNYFTAKGLLALQRGCLHLHTLIVYPGCPLRTNELAISLWKELRPGFTITCDDSIDYDAMKNSL